MLTKAYIASLINKTYNSRLVQVSDSVASLRGRVFMGVGLSHVGESEAGSLR